MISCPAANGIRWVKPSSATRVAVVDELGHGLGQRHDLGHVRNASGRRARCAPRRDESGQAGAATAPSLTGRAESPVTIQSARRRAVPGWPCVLRSGRTPPGRLHPSATCPSTGSATARCSCTGPGVWGPPRDHDEAHPRAAPRGRARASTFIDTADSYGPYVAEDLLREALHPYADDLVIATKAGLTRAGPGRVDSGRAARSTCASRSS